MAAKTDAHTCASTADVHHGPKEESVAAAAAAALLVVDDDSSDCVATSACSKLWWIGMSCSREKLDDDLCKGSAHCSRVDKGHGGGVVGLGVVSFLDAAVVDPVLIVATQEEK